MVLRLLEGFETKQNTSTKLDIAYLRTGSVAFVGGRKGTGSALSSLTCTLTSKDLVSADENTWIVGFAVQKPAITTIGASSTAGLQLRNAAGEQCSLVIIDAGSGSYRMRLKRGSTTIDTTTGAFPWGGSRSWMYFQLKVTVRDGTDGVYELRSYDYLNNMTVEFSGSSVNLAEQAADGADRLKISWVTDTGGNITIDDVFAMDSTGAFNNDFMTEPMLIMGSLPNGAGNQTDFTPDAGANYTNVDDAATTGSDTDKVISAIVSDIDLYNYADFPFVHTSGTAVIGVQVMSSAAMVASGSRTVRVRVRESAAEAFGNNIVLNDLILDTYRQMFDQNPTGTPATWTKATVEAAEFGIEIQA
jgi:hypothetical protein